MNSFQYVSDLQYRIKALEKQVEDFKSGEKYVQMEATHHAIVRDLQKELRAVKHELETALKQIVSNRNMWMDAMEDLQRQCQKELERKERLLQKANREKEEALRQRDEALNQKREKQLRIYELETQLLEEQEKNRKLTAQVNRDFENSSIPSSMQSAGRKKIPNSRGKTGRKPGAQPGHEGHARKRHTPTESYEIPASEYENDPDYYETGRWIRKQKVEIQMLVRVIECYTKEFRKRSTGARVHAPFPEGFVDDVNYDGTVKAFAYLLGNECNVSHEKIKKLLAELTEGEIDISVGMINHLCREFSEKTEPEKKEILCRLMTSPVINADFTNANVNGQSAQVLVLASPSENVALYIGREKKGHEGIRGTPLEDYVGTVVHDHDSTFYHYGIRHQECMQHNCRYLVGSEQNEPELEWNKQMHSLVREMLHYRNGLGDGDELDPGMVADFETRYDRILEEGRKEYEDNPPSEYYPEGYNLCVRLQKYKESELLFLHDMQVPTNNSICERLARVYKRKQKQATVFRSQEQLEYICDGLSTVYLLRTKDIDVYQELSDIFNRRLQKKKIRSNDPSAEVTA